MFDGISGDVEQGKASMARNDELIKAVLAIENAKALLASLVATQEGRNGPNQAQVDGLLRCLDDNVHIAADILHENIGL
jgi:hypothetical protein